MYYIDLQANFERANFTIFIDTLCRCILYGSNIILALSLNFIARGMTKTLTREIDLVSGIITKEVYRVGRKRHRDPLEGPAVIERCRATGTITFEEYRVNGRLHREGGPASISRWSTGAVTFEEYRLKGRQHRDPADGAAFIDRDGNTGVVVQEHYIWNGKLHRDPNDGPAVIYRDWKTGITWNREYWLHGQQIAAPRRRVDAPRRVVRGNRPSP